LQWEKASPVTLLFLVTAGTREEHFEILYRCLRKVKDEIGIPERTDDDAALLTEAINVQPAVLPRDAALCDGELLPLEACEGRIASQLIVPYPPGIPVLIPGLRITKPMIQLIRTILQQAGAEAIHGLFIRGKQVMIEVLNRDEEDRVCRLTND
jgi:arginine/lysine/ornithine decarboxylase